MSGGAGSISECWFGSASIWNGSPPEKRGREISERTSSGGFFSHRPAVLVRANDAGEIEWAEGVLGEMLPKIIRKRLRKRIVTIQAELLNEARQVELAIRMEDDPEAVFPKKGPLNPKNLSGDFQENDFSRVSVSGKNPSKKITRLHGAENDGTKLAAE